VQVIIVARQHLPLSLREGLAYKLADEAISNLLYNNISLDCLASAPLPLAMALSLKTNTH
jgi:hypothetical protein